MPEPVTVHAFVSGRVQGVAYRASLADEARRLRLCGFVRNLADGRVEYIAQGPDAAVAQLVEWSRQGPRWASVTDVEYQTLNESPAYEDFRIEATR